MNILGFYFGGLTITFLFLVFIIATHADNRKQMIDLWLFSLLLSLVWPVFWIAMTTDKIIHPDS